MHNFYSIFKYRAIGITGVSDKKKYAKKLHMHERSFTYFFSKFYRLIEKKVF